MNLHLLNPVTIHSANPRSPRPDIPNVSITLPGNLGKTCNEMINILFGRVGREAGARRALDPQRQHQRLRAVMAVPQRQSIGVEPAANVFRPHTGNGKGHDPASLQGSYGSYHANTLETGQRVEKPAGEPPLMLGDSVPIETFHPADRRPEPDGRPDWRSAGLEPAWRIGELRSVW